MLLSVFSMRNYYKAFLKLIFRVIEKGRNILVYEHTVSAVMSVLNV